MLSLTTHWSTGQSFRSIGKGMRHFRSVLRVGFAPEGPASVYLFTMASLSFSFGIRDLKSKWTEAFLTGRMPMDYSSLRPRMLISNCTLFMLMKSRKLSSFGILGSSMLSISQMSKLTRISPSYGPSWYSYRGCHWGFGGCFKSFSCSWISNT